LGGGFWATGIMTGVWFLVNFMKYHPIQRANILTRNIFGS